MCRRLFIHIMWPLYSARLQSQTPTLSTSEGQTGDCGNTQKPLINFYKVQVAILIYLENIILALVTKRKKYILCSMYPTFHDCKRNESQFFFFLFLKFESIFSLLPSMWKWMIFIFYFCPRGKYVGEARWMIVTEHI